MVLIQLLAAIQEVAGQPIRNCFDWIGGTSTGAILALAIVHGQSAHCHVLFTRELRWGGGRGNPTVIAGYSAVMGTDFAVTPLGWGPNSRLFGGNGDACCGSTAVLILYFAISRHSGSYCGCSPVPVTSTSSERSFSLAGCTLEERCFNCQDFQWVDCCFYTDCDHGLDCSTVHCELAEFDVM